MLWVVHRGFTPLQNGDAGLIFDAIFGQGKRAYHTGLSRRRRDDLATCQDRQDDRVAGDDTVQPYDLLANSHDGSMAFNIRLTTGRVVCQNTLVRATPSRTRDRRSAHVSAMNASPQT